MKQLIESLESRHQQQMEDNKKQRELLQSQLQAMATQGDKGTPVTATHTTATPSFAPFDSTSDLWADYWKSFDLKEEVLCRLKPHIDLMFFSPRDFTDW
ncbi:hypothetical protein, partial [Klebsiella pneumoniae]|uniref:hypothetical protein n=1 Tax=Klebsiella pneumoniae TaxID=573 RepID=UPI003EBA7A28